MKMRTFVFVLGVCVSVVTASAAMAFENFIPSGTGYSSTVGSLPSFDSAEGQTVQQADVYETELYLQARKRVEDESRFREFFSNTESTGANGHIDY